MGLVPVERQSGSSLLGRAKLSKAGPAKVSAVLYMAAIVATKPPMSKLYLNVYWPEARAKCQRSALACVNGFTCALAS
ncbi:transposase [Deefgea sp. CFH1-16]|nr:transposase [Deefgea sp. CFH1-16]